FHFWHVVGWVGNRFKYLLSLEIKHIIIKHVTFFSRNQNLAVFLIDVACDQAVSLLQGLSFPAPLNYGTITLHAQINGTFLSGFLLLSTCLCLFFFGSLNLSLLLLGKNSAFQLRKRKKVRHPNNTDIANKNLDLKKARDAKARRIKSENLLTVYFTHIAPPISDAVVLLWVQIHISDEKTNMILTDSLLANTDFLIELESSLSELEGHNLQQKKVRNVLQGIILAVACLKEYNMLLLYKNLVQDRVPETMYINNPKHFLTISPYY
ncbi:hypothetical protein ACJX0J_024520, partial [Zea mays]